MDREKMLDLIKIKADLICLGIQYNETAKDIFQVQNPSNDWKTGNIGLHLILDGKSYILVTASHEFNLKSPYKLGKRGDKLLIYNEEKEVCEVSSIDMPKWYNSFSSTNKPMPEIFLREGKKFLHQTYQGCDYHKKGLGCKFCGTGDKWKMGNPGEVGEVIAAATKEKENYQICLGGGSTLPPSKKVEYFMNCIKEIRKINRDIPIWVEMIPPTDEEIEELVKQGATSFGFNIEIWDDTLKKEVCPGKFAITKDRYIKAMKKVLDLLGSNRIGSCLICGLEPLENTIEGAKELSSLGIQPCIIPFKPWDKSQYSNKDSCTANDLLKVSFEAAKAMVENNVNPNENQGCLSCDSCTIDHDLHNYIKQFGCENISF